MATFEKNTPIYVGDVRSTTRKDKESAMCYTVNDVLGRSKTCRATQVPANTYVNKFEWNIDGDFDWDLLHALKQVFATVQCVGNTLTVNKEDALFDQSMISQNLEKKTNMQALFMNVAFFVILSALLYTTYLQ